MGSLFKLCLLQFVALLFPISVGAVSCYELVWSDEFNYTGLPDSTKWTNEVGGTGWGNNELQYYTDRNLNNSRVEDGCLIIEARKESYSGRDYTSARLITYPNDISWRYGKIEAKIKLPYGQGIWPAFWMLGNGVFEGEGWPGCGEIDILEMVGGGEGRDDVIHGTIHYDDLLGAYQNNGESEQLSTGIFNDDFHVFSVEWDQYSIKWFLDDVQYHSVAITDLDLRAFHSNFFIILNLAVGGDWPGSPDASTVFPQQMLVDYVRVYQKNTEPEIFSQDSVLPAEKNVNFSTVESSDFTYLWSVPDDATIVSGQGTHSIIVNWGCDTGSVVCNLTTLCNFYTLKRKLELKNSQISGKELVEVNEINMSYSVPLTSNAHYNWVIPDGVSLNSKIDSNIISLDWNDLDGEIEVQISNICGKDTAKQNVLVVNQTPYPITDQAHAIPGIITSVSYDFGGEGFAYHDIDPENQGTGSRQTEGVDTEANDGGENIGWIESGEWVEYTVEVESSGFYNLDIRIASPNSTGSFSISFNDENRTGTISVPYTGAWNSFSTIHLADIELYDTDNLLRVDFINGGFNLGRMEFTSKISGINESERIKDNILVYPTNPTNRLFIEGLNSVSNYKLTDMSGKVLRTGQIYLNNSIPVRNLESGLYLLLIEDLNNSLLIRKFIKP